MRPANDSRGGIGAVAVRRFLAMILATCAGHGLLLGQSELLPVHHPVTWALIRIYEFGGIQEFPREHLPISRGLALRLLNEAERDERLPVPLRELANYYGVELTADMGAIPTAVFIPTTDTSRWVVDRPFAGLPLAIAEYRDAERGSHAVLEPVLDGDLRLDPSSSDAAWIMRGGVQLRGTLMERFGFSARVTNGTVIGDSSLAARDPRIAGSGSYSVTAFGRDILLADAHLRADFDVVALEIGHETVQLGGGLEKSLLLGSLLPSNYDYLRFSARVGRFAFTHLHAALLGESVGAAGSGPFADIPQKYVAAHLLSVGPFAGVRLSIGESVVYRGRGLELGYLNPLLFMKSQEQYLRDRDNANMYVALSINPADRIFLEGELMLDDLRFSLIGDGFWGNKSAWRVGARATAFPVDALDLGVSYTRLEPYVFSHFNRENAYVHHGAILAGAGLQPNSHLVEGTFAVVPTPKLWVRGAVGFGEHGGNILGRNSSNDGDTLLYNAGGDVMQTRRGGIDSLTVRFLDGDLQTLLRGRLEMQYEPLRNIYLRLLFLYDQTSRQQERIRDTQLQLGLRIGAF